MSFVKLPGSRRSWIAAVLAASAAVPSAQGTVWTVDDGSTNFEGFGAAWRFDRTAGGALDTLAALPLPIEVSDRDFFAGAVAPLGDLNGDGVPDLAVGASRDDRSGTDRGAVWILFFEPGGTLAQASRAIRPDFDFAAPSLPPGDRFGPGFGGALASLGDLDGDGRIELAVGSAPPLLNSTLGGNEVWILSLEPDGHVARSLRIGAGSAGFGGGLDPEDRFGAALAAIGDLDGDGNDDLAVGAPYDDDGANNAGAVWILFLEADGTVRDQQKISATAGGLMSPLDPGDYFGASIAALGDLDGDGVTELAVGAAGDDDGAAQKGAVYVLFLEADGTVGAEQKLSQTAGGLGAFSQTLFGSSVVPLGDADGNGTPDVAVGAPDTGTGAVFVLLLNSDGTVASRQVLTTEFTGVASGDKLGQSLASVGDWDLDGRPDFVVGAATRAGPPTLPDFTDVQAAVNAAASGDTILIRGGVYVPSNQVLTVDGKSLTIQAANPGNVRVDGRLRITNLSAAQTVRVSGLVFRGVSSVGPKLDLENNAGTVWIDSCRWVSESFLGWFGPGLRAVDCAAVVLNRSSLRGGNEWAPSSPPPVGPPGIELDQATLHAYDCSITGSTGGSYSDSMGGSHYQEGGMGLASLSASDEVFLAGCTVTGGLGHAAPNCTDGGDALEVIGTVRAVDTSFTGGTGCPDGVPGTAGVEFLGGASVSMRTETPTRGGQDTLISFQGPPGTPVFVGFAPVPQVHFRPAHLGTALLGAPVTLRFLGVTDADGWLKTVQHLGLVPPVLDVVRFHTQCVFLSPSSLSVASKTRRSPATLQLGPGAVIQRLQVGF